MGGLQGDDTLDGGAGEDMLTGGLGADTFVFRNGDTITDFGLGGGDAIDISHFDHINADNFEANVTMLQVGDDVEVRIGDAVVTLQGAGFADYDITVDDFILG